MIVIPAPDSFSSTSIFGASGNKCSHPQYSMIAWAAYSPTLDRTTASIIGGASPRAPSTAYAHHNRLALKCHVDSRLSVTRLSVRGYRSRCQGVSATDTGSAASMRSFVTCCGLPDRASNSAATVSTCAAKRSSSGDAVSADDLRLAPSVLGAESVSISHFRSCS